MLLLTLTVRVKTGEGWRLSRDRSLSLLRPKRNGPFFALFTKKAFRVRSTGGRTEEGEGKGRKETKEEWASVQAVPGTGSEEGYYGSL